MLTPPSTDFGNAARTFNADEYQAFVHDAEQERVQTTERYPRSRWAAMALAEYAQGQADHSENFCRWMEWQTLEMGSIRGGSARKLIIYKHREKPGWYFPPEYADEHDAWESENGVRAGFVTALEFAESGRFDEIDAIPALSRGAALVAKTIWTYFPDELIPINSSANLRHFLRVVGRDDLADDQSLRTIGLNRGLLAELRQRPELRNAPTKALERLLYSRFNPFEGRVVKIAPGERGIYWEECLAGGYICVGWDEVGDLRDFESKEAFLEAFRQSFPDYDASKTTQKAGELWLLLELAVGERVVANRGIKEVLGLGTIVSPGYEWRPDREVFRHTVRVSWDDSYGREIPPQPYWGLRTVLPLTKKQAEIALGEARDNVDTSVVERTPPLSGELPLFGRIAEALERKGQAILYGPPGTGKTFHARAFADWWLSQRNGDLAGDALEWVTFHPSYSYEDFVEGFRPEQQDGTTALALVDGIFKTLSLRAAETPDRTFLLVIDEINRANLTKVLGELITLIELDKRGDSLDAPFTVTLPYSRARFVVPPNLHLLGTMNTADRSIKMLDTALRRRFGFVELVPDPALLATDIGGIALDELLRALNRRVARDAGREKRIGHSYFLRGGQPISDETEFTAIFRDEIVPLLQEYSVDDYEELAGYLGPVIVDIDGLQLNEDVLADASRLLEALEEHLLTDPPQ